MSYHFPPEVDAIVRRQMASGQYASEDQLLLDALRSLECDQQDWRAVQESLHALDRGEQGVSLDEAFASIRSKYDIPQDA